MKNTRYSVFDLFICKMISWLEYPKIWSEQSQSFLTETFFEGRDLPD